MTKFFLGLAVGYLFSDVIDELIGRASGDGGEEPTSEPGSVEYRPMTS